MAISRIGQNSAASTTVSIPAHVAGDLLLFFAYRSSSATVITVPGGVTSLSSVAANTNASAVGYKIASSSSETSGTWTNAESLIVVVYRGASGVGASSVVTNATTPFPYPSLTLNVTTGTSWVVAAVGVRIDLSAPETPPSGMTNVSDIVITTGEAALHDTNGGVSSWAGGNGGSSGGFRYRIHTIEILAADTGIVGTLNATLGALTSASTGQLAISGSLSAAFGALTASATAALEINGAASITLGELTSSAAGTLAITGALDATFGELTSTATGTLPITGGLSATFGELVLSAQGGEPQNIDVPPERTYNVPPINRVTFVKAVSRTYNVPPFNNEVTVK